MMCRMALASNFLASRTIRSRGTWRTTLASVRWHVGALLDGCLATRKHMNKQRLALLAALATSAGFLGAGGGGGGSSSESTTPPPPQAPRKPAEVASAAR